MRLPLLVRWASKEGQTVETSTETQDVSSRGIYFYVDKHLPPGSPVEILLTLPTEITMAGPVRVRCLGRITRVEPQNSTKRLGIAAEIDRYEFVRGEPA
jgi:hypothetical protein